ncbi:MAG: hypothetical protein QME96_05680 [Myxococcota bacterium]|nr:hypothetical protein [Myxococcota bacterium]
MSNVRFLLLAGPSVAAVLAVLAHSCATAEVPCEGCTTASCCNDRCVDLDGDRNNCGYCGNSCGDGSCVGGLCLCGDNTCSFGQTCCRGTCVILSRDRENCGLCGNRCPDGVGCSGGVCTDAVCPGGCAAGLECCGMACVDTRTDVRNCGRCGATCDAGSDCLNSVCVTPACSPPCGGTSPNCCGVTCTNTTTDRDNCGFCDNRCEMPLANACGPGPAGGRCMCGSSSACRTGQQCCVERCANVSVDPANCGDCGRACGPGETCRAGVCQCGTTGAPCPDGLACCGGECIDVSADPANCGECGRTCTGATDTCVGGACRCGSGPPCRAGLLYCMGELGGQRCCDGVCVALDPNACSGCGNTCADGQTCFGLYPACSCI